MRRRSSNNHGWVLLALLTAACASGGKPHNLADGGQDGGAALGTACTTPSECATGICYVGPNGGVCAAACDAKTPCLDGFACHQVTVGRTDQSLCLPLTTTMCATCQHDGDCVSGMCRALSDGRFCTMACDDNPGVCPLGFACQAVHADNGDLLGHQCIPDTGICCVDYDGDGRGQGADCRAADCDDDDPAIYDDAVEKCDGKDNDCKGGVDVGATDCAPPTCQLGALGYFAKAAAACVAGACAEPTTTLCGLYTCALGGEAGDTCATSCSNDNQCVPDAHCDGTQCVADLVDGSACDEHTDCAGGHCQNGFCCAFGDCCQNPEDCPSFGTSQAVCDNPPTCQGTRGEAVCTANYVCSTTGVSQDDSACTAAVVANPCGLYKDVSCAGGTSQGAPSCPTSCEGDGDCDAAAFCQLSTHTCVADLGDGAACAADSGACSSGHCGNGFCCAAGDCCATATDCPASYGKAPVCDSPASCQGTVDAASCVASTCGTAQNVQDDSACGAQTVSDTCGPYKPVTCSGAVEQGDPPCPTSCTTDGDCDPNAYCSAAGQCVNDEANGRQCQEGAACASGHCQNGFCCASGDCCATGTDCDAYDLPPSCTSATTCQGNRRDGVCSSAFQCSGQTVADDSGCAGQTANDCGPYTPVVCTSATSQSAGTCGASCTGDAQCDPSAHCAGNVCVADAGQGGFCNNTSECTGGLACVDHVCCGSSCTSTCQACDLVGSVGTCATIPLGQDPAGECAGASCSGFFFGWLGNVCYRKADVTDTGATCGGGTACQSQSAMCTAQTARGAAAVTCDSVCQAPNTAASCTGTTAGTCTNLNLGTQSCGNGVCAVTQARCVNGAQQACTPNSGAQTAEACDGLDNDCDGVVDDGLPTDAFESNNTCPANANLGVINEGSTLSYSTMSIYSGGDQDWYRQLAVESTAPCTPGATEGPYNYVVTMTPPAGKDYDLELCYNAPDNPTCSASCFTSTLAGSATEQIHLTWTGICGGNDGLNFFIHVYGFAGASTCTPYQLTTAFTNP